MSRSSAKDQFREADALFRQNRCQEALALLTELSREFPNEKNILYPMALCLEKLGRSREAQKVCHDLIRLSNHPKAWEMLERIETGGQTEAAPQAALPPRPVSVSKQPPKAKTIGFAIAFIIGGVPFLIVSGAFAHELFSSVAVWKAMQSWEEIPAIIKEAHFTERRIEGSDIGDVTITYSVAAQYTYEYRGRMFTGGRVFAFRGSEGSEAFIKEAYRQLAEHQESGRPFRCYVNPINPAEAMLFRDLPVSRIGWNIATLLVALLGGVLFPYIGITKIMNLWTAAALQAKFPGQPWRWRKKWKTGNITCSNRKGMIVLIITSVFVDAFTVIFLLNIQNISAVEGMGLRDFFAIGMLVFLAALVTLAAFFATLRWRKFGASTLQMTSMPGVIGGFFSGMIHLPAHIRPEEGFTLQLKCTKRVTTGSGENKRVSTQTLWSQKQFVTNAQTRVEHKRVTVPVRFSVPHDQPESAAEAGGAIAWHLDIKAAVPGIDYSAAFEVPLFKAI